MKKKGQIAYVVIIFPRIKGQFIKKYSPFILANTELEVVQDLLLLRQFLLMGSGSGGSGIFNGVCRR